MASVSFSRFSVRQLCRAAGAGALAALSFSGVCARVLVSQDKALAEAFPGAVIERHTAYLTDAQAAEVEALAGTPPASRVVPWYAASREGKPVGTAWFDTHLVRTLPETLLVAIGPDGTVARVEVLSFEEPPEYLPRPRWFDELRGRKLDADLAPGRGVPLVTGATLSSRAATAAVRRALALHAIIVGKAPPPPSAAPPPPAPPVPTPKDVRP